MYKIDFTATVRKSVTLTIFALFLLMCIFSLMIGSTFHIADPPDKYLGIDSAGATDDERIRFLQTLGYSPSAQLYEQEQINIPVVFGDVYSRYNELQAESGGDLSLYKGAECTRYTYIDEKTNMRLDLIVYDGKASRPFRRSLLLQRLFY